MCQEWCLMVWKQGSNKPHPLRCGQSEIRAGLCNAWGVPGWLLGLGREACGESCYVIAPVLRALGNQLHAVLLASVRLLPGRMSSILLTSTLCHVNVYWGACQPLRFRISDILESQLKYRIFLRLDVSLLFLFIVKVIILNVNLEKTGFLKTYLEITSNFQKGHKI